MRIEEYIASKMSDEDLEKLVNFEIDKLPDEAIAHWLDGDLDYGVDDGVRMANICHAELTRRRNERV